MLRPSVYICIIYMCMQEMRKKLEKLRQLEQNEGDGNKLEHLDKQFGYFLSLDIIMNDFFLVSFFAVTDPVGYNYE